MQLCDITLPEYVVSSKGLLKKPDRKGKAMMRERSIPSNTTARFITMHRVFSAQPTVAKGTKAENLNIKRDRSVKGSALQKGGEGERVVSRYTESMLQAVRL